MTESLKGKPAMTNAMTVKWHDDGSLTWTMLDNGAQGDLDAVEADQLIRALERGPVEAQAVAVKFKRGRRFPPSDEAQP